MAGIPPALVRALEGRYALERELGRGGMATVWLGRDLKYERLVAVKVLHPELGAALGAERFLREVRVTAKLQHPHILPVFDSGEIPDERGIASPLLWFTMPYVAGESLRQRISREKSLPLAEALQIAYQVAEAVDYAHSQGIIHRDIKPENILLSRDHAVVADFGIAKALTEAGEGLTGTGLAIGTPAYMSPEQATGGQVVDARSDVYSIGCVLYEMLAGGPAFAGSTPRGIIGKQLSSPPPSLRRENAPIEVDRLLQRAMAVEPAERFGSAAELARAIKKLGTPQPAWSRIRWRVPALVVALGASVGGGVFFFSDLQRGTARPHLPKLVVLPFDNLGPERQRYFVDGITDEITSRLGGVAGLRVIAQTSAKHYRGADKTIAQIGKELGADYALEGSARWEPGAAVANRVRVNARLIRTSDGSLLWGESFDAVLAGMFQLQAEIAEKVAQGLHVTLLEPERRRLAVRPTGNLAAYDYFLQGRRHLEGWVERDLRIAVQMFEQAVALDSSFAAAFASLARSHAKLYWHDYDRTETRLAKAHEAAKRAVSLGPDLADAHLAMGYYYYWGSLDYDRALREFEIAGKLEPSNSDLFQAIGSVERRLGRFASAAGNLEVALELDPKSVEKAEALAVTYYFMRRYEEAERFVNRAISLGPDQYQLYGFKILIYLSWRGDVPKASQVLREASEGIPEQELVNQLLPYFGVSFFQVLDPVLSPDHRRALDQMSMEPFGTDSSFYFVVRGTWSRHRGLQALARAYFDSARVVLEAEIREDSMNAQAHSSLGLVYAELGRKDAAIREGELAKSLVPVTKEAVAAVDFIETLAQIYLTVGQPDRAMDQLEVLLTTPGSISPVWLMVDPRWTVLRGNQRFKRLVAAGPEVELSSSDRPRHRVDQMHAIPRVREPEGVSR